MLRFVTGALYVEHTGNVPYRGGVKKIRLGTAVIFVSKTFYLLYYMHYCMRSGKPRLGFYEENFGRGQLAHEIINEFLTHKNYPLYGVCKRSM